MKLYEINSMLVEAINVAEELVNPETGELPEDWSNFLDQIQMERDSKCLDVARYIKGLEAEAKAIREEERILAARRRSVENEAEDLRKYIIRNVQIGEKIDGVNTVIGWRKSTSVNVLNPDKVPDMYCKIERKPILPDLKQAITSGVNLEGIAELKVNNNLQIK
jgi:hypothetical protein